MTQPLLRVLDLEIGLVGAPPPSGKILRGVSLELAHDRALGIVGESGSGKSTLGLALAGYLKKGLEVRAGTVQLRDVELLSATPAQLQAVRRREVRFVPQNAGQALTPTMRVDHALEGVLGDTQARGQSWNVEELLSLVRFAEPQRIARSYPHQLSGGQQQRVAIAMGLAPKPDVLILDEPTSGLDVTIAEGVMRLLASLRDQLRMSVVMISHDLRTVMRLTDEVVVMYSGEVFERLPSKGFGTKAAHPYSQGLVGAMPSTETSVLPIRIDGKPPDPRLHIEGCRFSARCSLSTDECLRNHPSLRMVGGSPLHIARCHYLEKTKGMLGSAPVSQPWVVAETAQTPVLEVRNVHASYRSRNASGEGGGRRLRVLESVSLLLHEREIVAVVGESGSGKSTLARVIAGLHAPDSGQVLLHGDPLGVTTGKRTRDQLADLQIVFQNSDAALNPRHRVKYLLERPGQLHRRGGQMGAQALLERVGLHQAYENRYPGQLSGGERQRVAIARALVTQPKVIVCDEILSALDVSVQASILHLIEGLRRIEGLSCVFIAHDLAVVRAIADRVIVIQGGTVCEEGSTGEIFRQPKHPYSQELIAASRTQSI